MAKVVMKRQVVQTDRKTGAVIHYYVDQGSGRAGVRDGLRSGSAEGKSKTVIAGRIHA